MTKTSYEKEGLNSLNELFEKLIVCSEKQDKESTMRIVSSLNDEEKDYLYTWASEQGKLDKVAGIVVKAELDKKAFDINCRFKKQVLEALPIHGYCLENDPSNPDCFDSEFIKFTDNKYINGEIRLSDRKVVLEARDAENKKYEKTIDYSEIEDLMESINHFQNDIKETFEKKEEVVEEVKEEPFDILNDPAFMKQIGADWVSDLIKKKAEGDTGFDGKYDSGDVIDAIYKVLEDNANFNYGWDWIKVYKLKDIHSIGYYDYSLHTADSLDSFYQDNAEFLDKYFVNLDTFDKFLAKVKTELETNYADKNTKSDNEEEEIEDTVKDKSASAKRSLNKKAAEPTLEILVDIEKDKWADALQKAQPILEHLSPVTTYNADATLRIGGSKLQIQEAKEQLKDLGFRLLSEKVIDDGKDWNYILD